MYLMYIDESGDTISLARKGKSFLVLTGCIIHESLLVDIEEKFRSIKKRFYQDPDIEIKSNFLRYANPDLKQSSPLKLHSREKYNELESEISNFLKEVSIDLLSVAISKKEYWDQYPSQNPYHIAYVFLLERFQMYLDSKDELGICIIDPREGQVEKHFIGNELSDLHDKMRWKDGKIWKRCPNIVEKLLFSQSDKTIGIQLADLYCYPIFHVLEYDKSKDEYWRFMELSYPKLVKSDAGRADGYGLKLFPRDTKKGLKLFQ